MAQSDISLAYPANAHQFAETALKDTVAVVKGSAGTLYAVEVDNTLNPNAASFLKMWDTAGAVTLGTTAPDWIVKIPGGSKPVSLPLGGVAFAAGLKAAVVTVGGTGGIVAPTSNVGVRIVYS